MTSSGASSLLIVALKSMGAAYLVGNSVRMDLGERLLEIIPQNEGAVCLVELPNARAEAFLREQRTADLTASEIISSFHGRLLPAFYGIQLASPKQSLIIAESNWVGALFSLGNEALNVELEVADFKSTRAGREAGLLILTGAVNSSSAEELLRRHRQNSRVRIEKLDEISESLRPYFLGAK